LDAKPLKQINTYLVAQLGARMHYAVPRILHDADVLESLHTDICAVKGWPAVARTLIPQSIQPRGLQQLLGRVPKGVPPSMIIAYTAFGWEYARRRRAARGAADTTKVHIWAGETFNQLIIKHGIGDAAAVYTFNSAGLELLQEARRCGLKAITEQTIAPQVIERELLDPEFARFPEIQGMIEPVESWRRFADREAAEWEAADLILCGSQFVVDGIRNAGGPSEKAVVVPYGIDLAQFKPPVRTARRDTKLNVLFVGQVGIRKGAHYLIEAARLLEKSHPHICFLLVGTIALPASVLESLPVNVRLCGPIPRTEIHLQFARADIFCLPSLCEGSATVVYEALAMGLPVVCTPNTGSVVTDGLNGYLVPIRDARAIAERIADLACDQPMRDKFSRAALVTAENYTIGDYGIRLLGYLSDGKGAQ
jgi:hypothetical protein